MRVEKFDQITRTARVQKLVAWLVHGPRQFADDRIIFFAIGFLDLRQGRHINNRSLRVSLAP